MLRTLDELDPELRWWVVRGILTTAGLAILSLVVWVVVVMAPAPLDSTLRPVAWIASAPAAICLLGTLLLYAFAYLTRQDR